ncbi:MAG: sodium/glutamate symporter [Candidatus Neomarinimicrobiota bacterium]|jgi:ESS family glutamate:Na+ symporter|nr:sodium/glutamate symporter [bacterium]
MAIVLSFTSLCILLVAGKLLRVRIRIFQKLYLPAAVIGGLLGLILIQSLGKHLPSAVHDGWEKLPGFLINICFACLFLGVRIPKLSKIWQQSGPQLAYGQIVAWGQYVVGIGLALVLLTPLFHIPAYFGVIIPVGFEGGHGTASGLAEQFAAYGWPEGRDFAMTSATFGIISAIISGTWLINRAVRKGYTRQLKRIEDIPENNVIGIYDPDEQPSAGRQTVAAGSVDSFALHLAIVGLAVFIGYAFKLGLTALESLSPAMQKNGILSSFPLFPLAMVGGLLIQLFISRVLNMAHILDRETLHRISGTALDFLVVSAVAMINISMISSNIVPLLILVAAGILWNTGCVLFLARRLLPDAWFERAIAEMGQSMGVTATGLLLLRVVDPEQKTAAYPAFGYKQLLHEPIMGGGIWTSVAFPLCILAGPLTVFLIACSAIGIWLIVWLLFFRKNVAALKSTK